MPRKQKGAARKVDESSTEGTYRGGGSSASDDSELSFDYEGSDAPPSPRTGTAVSREDVTSAPAGSQTEAVPGVEGQAPPSWYSADRVTQAVTDTVTRLWNAAFGSRAPAAGDAGESRGLVDEKPAPAQAERSTRKRSKEKELIAKIREYSAVVREGHDPNVADLVGMIGREEAAAHSASHALFEYRLDHHITARIWREAHKCPNVWMMVGILRDAGADVQRKRLRAAIQKSIDAKLATDPSLTGGDCAPQSGRDDNLLFLDECFQRVPKVRITPEQAGRLRYLGAEWEQLLSQYPDVHDGMSTCEEVSYGTYMHWVTVLTSIVFMWAEVGLAVAVVMDLRLSRGIVKYTNYAALLYLGGGLLEVIVLTKMFAELKDANAISLSVLPLHYLKAVPVLPVLESVAGWMYIRSEVWPDESPSPTENRFVIMWDLRQLFHLSKQLHAMLVSFPFALYLYYIDEYNLPEERSHLMVLAQHFALANVARAICASLWNLSVSRNVTLWGMKQTFSYPPHYPPSPIVRFTLVLLAYYMLFHFCTTWVGVLHNNCDHVEVELNVWVFVESLITFITFIIFVLFIRMTRETRGTRLIVTLKWMAVPMLLRVGWVTWGFMLLEEVKKDCFGVIQYMEASLILDMLSFCVAIILVIIVILRGPGDESPYPESEKRAVAVSVHTSHAPDSSL